jgi:hypothetical protein
MTAILRNDLCGVDGVADQAYSKILLFEHHALTLG